MTRTPRRRVNDNGSAAVEMAIIAPALIALMLLVVGMGRLSHGREQVEVAAAQAARAASLTRLPAQAGAAAQAAAQDALTSRGVTCAPSPVPTTTDVSDDRPGGDITVRVSCTVKLADLFVAGFPGSHTWTATVTTPVDTFEQGAR
jgi:Flp pilus assembly protein TadG